jgi:hypothetical protein
VSDTKRITNDWCEEVAPGRWKTTRPISFETRHGEVMVPHGFCWDKFSCVDDTEHPEFWLASLLHDFCRYMLAWGGVAEINTRRKTDVVFLDEMLIQAAAIFAKLRETQGTLLAVQEYISLIKRSFIYYRGVRGIFGTIYYWLGKIF